MSHADTTTALRYAAGELPLRDRSALRQHAVDCERCRRELERAILARRALGGDLSRPSALELSAWGEEIVSRAAGEEGRTAARLGSSLRLGLWIGLAACAALVVVMAGLPAALERDELQARGGASAPPLSLRALCVSAGQARDAEGGRCKPDEFVKLVVGRGASLRGRLAVLAAHSGGLEALYPHPFGAPLFSAPMGEPAPLSGSWPLAGVTGGTVRLVALVLDAEALPADDGLAVWAATARPGVFHDVLGRADAVVIEVSLTEERPGAREEEQP